MLTELSATVVGTVETDVLGADQVLAGLDAFRNGEVDRILAPDAPVSISARGLQRFIGPALIRTRHQSG